MRCNDCSQRADMACKCNGQLIFFCNLHYGEHLKVRSDHLATGIGNVLMNISERPERASIARICTDLLNYRDSIDTHIQSLRNLSISLRTRIERIIDVEITTYTITRTEIQNHLDRLQLNGVNINQELLELIERYRVRNLEGIIDSYLLVPIDYEEAILREISTQLRLRGPVYSPSRQQTGNSNGIDRVAQLEKENQDLRAQVANLNRQLSSRPLEVAPLVVRSPVRTDYRINIDRFVDLSGHTAPITAAGLSRDNQYMISGGEDNQIKVWNFQELSLAYTIPDVVGNIRCLAITPDTNFIVFAGEDKTIRIWNISQNQQEAVLPGHNAAVSHIIVTNDGRYIISAAAYPDYTIKIWNLASKRLESTLNGHSEEISSIASSYDSRFILSASILYNITIKVWDAITRQQLGLLRGHTSSITSLSCAKRRNIAASGSTDGTIRIWDIENISQIGVIRSHEGSVLAVSIIGLDNLIVSAGDDSNLIVWNIETRQPLTRIVWGLGRVRAMVVSENNSFILAGGEDGQLKIWSLNIS